MANQAITAISRSFSGLVTMRMLAACLLIVNSALLRTNAATNTAVSNGLTDVQNAVNACADGDSVQLLSAAPVIWNGNLNVTKAISIYGVDTNHTIIANGQAAGVDPLIIWQPANDKRCRISGIFWSNAPGNGQQYVIQIYGTTTQFRIDRCRFQGGQTIIAITLPTSSKSLGQSCGVIDHCETFDVSRFIYIADQRSGDSGTDGNVAWGVAPTPGTTNAWYEETCNEWKSSGFSGSAANEDLYGDRGGRFVKRNCNIYAASTDDYPGIDAHGLYGSVERGCYGYEIYSNLFGIQMSSRVIHLRGGAYHFIWQNQYWLTNTGSGNHVLLTYGSDDSGDYPTNCYSWSNSYNGVLSAGIVNNSTHSSIGTQIFTNQPQSGQNFASYAPLIYPHPLVTAEDGGAPSPPPGVTVGGGGSVGAGGRAGM